MVPGTFLQVALEDDCPGFWQFEEQIRSMMSVTSIEHLLPHEPCDHHGSHLAQGLLSLAVCALYLRLISESDVRLYD
jgi:hypothetical protein